MEILEIKNLTISFGGLKAIDSLDINIEENKIAAIIGPNGAGKTTFFNCITGMYKADFGKILVTNPNNKKTKNIYGLKINEITKTGLARTFQNIRLFQNMTVLENVMIGRHCRSEAGILGALLKGKKTILEEKKIIEDSLFLLDEVGILPLQNEFAKNLPYGLQRRLEIARALATEPFLLLLDEPAAGMNEKETFELADLLARIKSKLNISILLIEHDMSFVMSLSDKIFVMDYGKKIAEGTPQEIRKNPVVIEAYFGEEII